MLVFYSIAIICLTIIAVVYINYKNNELETKKYNANVQGWFLVKGDHICDRISAYSKTARLHNNLIDVKDFLKVINETQFIVRNELTYRPYREEVRENGKKAKKICPKTRR